jgi:UDP-N-acetylglucosamine 2-epimerase (non-hydrolysing)
MTSTKLKVMTVIGTRPEIIRLSRVMTKLDRYCDHIVVHTGQNYDYELNQIFFDDLGLRRPDVFLNASGESAAETIGRVIAESDKVLLRERPDALLVLGDTNSCLAVLAAKRRKVPIFHMEAGNRCFDMRVPEEINRKVVDHVSDVNLPYSDIARQCLLREGLPPDLVIKTGSPMFEVLAHNREAIDRSRVLERLGLEKERYFVVSSHREENVDSDESFDRWVRLLQSLVSAFRLPIIVSTHPRTRKRIDSRGVMFDPLVVLSKPLGFIDYVALQTGAKAVLSDSGTISEESSILNFPALNIRETQERHEAFEEGAVVLVGMSVDRVMQSLAFLEDQGRGMERTLRPVSDYGMPNVSDKVVRIVHSYTDYVRRVVWKRY